MDRVTVTFSARSLSLAFGLFFRRWLSNYYPGLNAREQSSATFFCFFAGTGEEQTARGAFSDALVGDSRGIRLIKIFFSQPEHKFRLWIRGYAKSAAWCAYLDGAQGRSGRGSVRPDRGKDLRAAHPVLRTATSFLALLKGMDDAVKLNQKNGAPEFKSSLTIRDISASVSEWFIHEPRHPTRVSRLVFVVF